MQVKSIARVCRVQIRRMPAFCFVQRLHNKGGAGSIEPTLSNLAEIQSKRALHKRKYPTNITIRLELTERLHSGP